MDGCNTIYSFLLGAKGQFSGAELAVRFRGCKNTSDFCSAGPTPRWKHQPCHKQKTFSKTHQIPGMRSSCIISTKWNFLKTIQNTNLLILKSKSFTDATVNLLDGPPYGLHEPDCWGKTATICVVPPKGAKSHAGRAAQLLKKQHHHRRAENKIASHHTAWLVQCSYKITEKTTKKLCG